MVLGISLDPVVDNLVFAEKFAYPFPLLSDVGKDVSLAFGAVSSKKDEYASRFTFVIGANGNIEQAIQTRDPGGQAAALLDD